MKERRKAVPLNGVRASLPVRTLSDVRLSMPLVSVNSLLQQRKEQGLTVPRCCHEVGPGEGDCSRVASLLRALISHSDLPIVRL